ncbi:unnamed protein product [Dracunculus medinensis]|uniref:Protein kinase domain-containing protein n=1 Tax=Dracunculus medinensis TaxID=318479 RepID=A0A3P7QXU7_DRAME|nr:unnamed protein product [Dracunculus medinensis]
MLLSESKFIGIIISMNFFVPRTGSYGRVFLAKDCRSDKYFALKKMQIKKLVQMRQTTHVHSEKNILEILSHPFIVKLYKSSIDKANLNMVFEYIPGGELFSYLRNVRRFSNSITRFYCSEIVLALEYLHSLNIAYRDLKPENLMLDHNGHIKMTDFGFAKVITERTWTMCGTVEYLAPEVFTHQGHGKAVDWWSLGILIYEMMVGVPPFQGRNVNEIFDNIRSGKLRFTRTFDFLAKDLVKKLLHTDQHQRLGNLKNGAKDVMNHKWFSDIAWTDLIERKIPPPIKPSISSNGDTTNFEAYEEDDSEEVVRIYLFAFLEIYLVIITKI